MRCSCRDDYAARFLQAGLTGTGFFAVALLANQLAPRLAREEAAAQRSQGRRTQAQVNELVIDTLGDGVLVVDAEARCTPPTRPPGRCSAGPAARRPPSRFGGRGRPGSRWRQLASSTFTQARRRRPNWRSSAAAASGCDVHVRTRLTPPPRTGTDSLCVLFLEDLREIEARLRTEKLAAMGRMSAAVAHEIRNPLAAITQANALLEEELTEPDSSS